MSTYSNPLTEYSPQMEAPDFELSTGSRVFDEYDEMDLAARMLEIANEQELDRFLSDLVRETGSRLGVRADSPVARAIQRVLRRMAGRALPGPGGSPRANAAGQLGSQLGRRLAEMAGPSLGIELEGLSHEDSEFRASRQLIRFAGEAVKNALESGTRGDPETTAHDAASRAAQVHAPGLDPDRPAFQQTPIHSNTRRKPMHDIDRTRPGYTQEMEPESYESENYEGYEGEGYEGEGYEGEGYEGEGYQAQAAEGESYEGEGYEGEGYEGEGYEGEGYEGEGYQGRGAGMPDETSPLNETEEMELVAELMELETEEQFEDFLSSLVSSVVKKVGGFIDSPTGQALGGLLKGAAKKLLPMAGQALGAFAGGPAGAMIGQRAGSTIAGSFEAEAEQLEWEAADTFVKLATDATKNVAQAPPGPTPDAVVTKAVTDAAKTHAPGLLVPGPGGPAPRPHLPCACRQRLRAGRWMRRGNQIVLFGA